MTHPSEASKEQAASTPPLQELPLVGYYGGKPKRIVIDYDDMSSQNIGNADGSVDNIVANLKDRTPATSESVSGAVDKAIAEYCATNDANSGLTGPTPSEGATPALDGPYATSGELFAELGSPDPEKDARGLDAVIRRQRMVDSVTPSSATVGEDAYINEMLDKHADRADMFQPETEVIETRWVKLMRPPSPAVEGEREAFEKAKAANPSWIDARGYEWFCEGARWQSRTSPQGEDVKRLVESCQGLFKFLRLSVNAGPMGNNPRMEMKHLENIRAALQPFLGGRDGQ